MPGCVAQFGPLHDGARRDKAPSLLVLVSSSVTASSQSHGAVVKACRWSAWHRGVLRAHASRGFRKRLLEQAVDTFGSPVLPVDPFSEKNASNKL